MIAAVMKMDEAELSDRVPTGGNLMPRCALIKAEGQYSEDIKFSDQYQAVKQETGEALPHLPKLA